MKELTKLAAQGKLKPRISHRFRLDQAVEADHRNLSLAILTALIGALLESSESSKVSVPTVFVTDERYVTLDCGNFA